MVDEHVIVRYRVSVIMAMQVTVVITDTQQGTYVCCLIRSKLTRYQIQIQNKNTNKETNNKKEKKQTQKVSLALSRPEIGNRGAHQ